MKKITKEDIKNWAKIHKKELLIAGGAAAGVVGLYIFNKSSASIPVKNRLVAIIQRSIVRDNDRTHALMMSCNTAVVDWDKAKEIFERCSAELRDLAPGVVDRYTEARVL